MAELATSRPAQAERAATRWRVKSIAAREYAESQWTRRARSSDVAAAASVDSCATPRVSAALGKETIAASACAGRRSSRNRARVSSPIPASARNQRRGVATRECGMRGQGTRLDDLVVLARAARCRSRRRKTAAGLHQRGRRVLRIG